MMRGRVRACVSLAGLAVAGVAGGSASGQDDIPEIAAEASGWARQAVGEFSQTADHARRVEDAWDAVGDAFGEPSGELYARLTLVTDIIALGLLDDAERLVESLGPLALDADAIEAVAYARSVIATHRVMFKDEHADPLRAMLLAEDPALGAGERDRLRTMAAWAAATQAGEYTLAAQALERANTAARLRRDQPLVAVSGFTAGIVARTTGEKARWFGVSAEAYERIGETAKARIARVMEAAALNEGVDDAIAVTLEADAQQTPARVVELVACHAAVATLPEPTTDLIDRAEEIAGRLAGAKPENKRIAELLEMVRTARAQAYIASGRDLPAGLLEARADYRVSSNASLRLMYNPAHRDATLELDIEIIKVAR